MTSVRGPGQKRWASVCAVAGHSETHCLACAILGDVNDHRVDRRPFLGREDSRDRRGIGGDRTQAVDRLGRERDQPALSAGSPPPRSSAVGSGWSGVDDDETGGVVF